MKKYTHTAALFVVVALFAALFFLTRSVSAAQRPACALFNDGPVVSEGGTATLAFIAVDRPTSVSISPAASGSPQLGQPDPDRTDGLQKGQIVTKAITKTTTFEMTVNNSAGSSKCSTTVYYKPMPSGGWDVPLVSQAPVFRRTDIPGGYDNSLGSFPFLGIQWIPGGYFAVSGYGNSGAGGSFYKTKPDKFESGGMYIFSETGSFLGAHDVIYDTSSRAVGCFELEGCSAGSVVHPVGQGMFVRDMQPAGHGFARSPVKYSVSSSGADMLSRLFYTQINNEPSNGQLKNFSHIAIAGNKMFGIATRADGGSGDHALEVYDLNFSLLGKYTRGVSSGLVPLFTPLVGIGEYILGTEDNRISHDWAGQATVKSSIPLNVYKAPSLQDITNHVSPQKVQTIEPPSSGTTFVRFAFDSTNPNKIALLWGETKGGTLDVYEVGADGLTRTARMKMDAKAPGMFESFTQGIFAVSGDHVVYGDCPGSDLEFDGWEGGHRWDSCEVVVREISTGKRLSVEPLPHADGFIPDYESLPRAQSPNAFAISPSGAILVSAVGFEDWGNLYLYQIGGITTGGPGPGSGTTTPPTGIGLSNMSEILSFAKSYLNLMQAVMGGGPSLSTGLFQGIGPSSDPALQGSLNQAIKIIEAN